MEIQVNGQNLVITEYIILNAEIDSAFQVLYSSFFSHNEKNIERLYNIYLPEFEPHLVKYFNSIGPNTRSQDSCLTNLMIIWRIYLNEGRLDEAMLYIDRVLDIVLDYERNNGIRVHKGTPLYHWGGTALLKGEIDKGFFLIHNAVDEDAITHNKENPQTPANRFITLDFQDERQFYGPIVRNMAEYLNNFLRDYRPLVPSTLQLEDFRNLFLANPPNRDAVFMFIHSIARLMELDRLPAFSKQNRFAGQYESNILLDIALVIEDTIKKINPSNGTFNNHAGFLLSQSTLTLNGNNLGTINRDAQNHFNQTLLDLLNRNYQIRGRNLSELECDIALTYIIRNRAAHNISTSTTIQTRFNDVRQSIFNTLFFCIDVLYQSTT